MESVDGVARANAWLRENLPSEQGLKQIATLGDPEDVMSQRESSIRTRIETVVVRVKDGPPDSQRESSIRTRIETGRL